MSKALYLFGSAAIIAIGMAGLYFKVEYSGWVLFTGCMCAWCSS
jgi:hypothetical protein